MYQESNKKTQFLTRCGLLRAIGEAGASASVLDPEPSRNGGEPLYGHYPVEYGLRRHEAAPSGHSDQGAITPKSEARERESFREQDACPEIQPKRRQYDHAA